MGLYTLESGQFWHFIATSLLKNEKERNGKLCGKFTIPAIRRFILARIISDPIIRSHR